MTQPPDGSDPGDSPAEAKPKRVTQQKRLNGWVVLLLFVIISGAFSFSAETWIGLAEIVGYRFGAGAVRLAWMLPVTVDGYLCLTTWLFLTAPPGSPLRRYAGWSLLVVVVLSVIAQGVYHALDAQGVDVAEVWPLVVAVGGLPPALLASSVHLLSIYLHHQGDSVARPRPARRRVAVDSAGAAAAHRADSSGAPQQRLALVKPRQPKRGGAGEVRVGDAALADAIRDYVLNQRRAGAEPAQRAMQRLVREHTGGRVGQRRCVRIADTITESSRREATG